MMAILQELIEALRNELQQYGEMLALLEQQAESIRVQGAESPSISAIETQSGAIQEARSARELAQKAFLLAAKLKTVDHEDNWEKDRPGFGTPGSMDRVFFSCAACHVGRVVVNGKMKFLPGMPNTQIEAQY